MQRVNFQVRVAVFNCQQILTNISFVIFDIVTKNKSNVAYIAWCVLLSTTIRVITVVKICE